MTLVYSTDGAAVSNTATVEDAPAIRITGANVTLTNTELGRIISDVYGQPAIAIEAAGATIVNELGGIIRSDYGQVVIAGSAGADTIVNSGLIVGIVSLGGGRDSYSESVSFGSPVDLGAGGDLFRAEGTHDYFSQLVTGGAGTDVFVLAGRFGVISGQGVTGFEKLVVERDAGNIVEFSGFTTIVIRPLEAGAPSNFKNFIDCVNPEADLAFSNQWLTVGTGSTFRNVTGSGGSEALEVVGTVLGDIDLGGGDDGLTLRFAGTAGAQVGGSIDGGDGVNTISLDADDGRTIDLSGFSGFTRLRTGTFTLDEANVRVLDADGYDRIEVQHGHLTIAGTEAPDASLAISPAASARLAGDSILGSVGVFYDGLDTTMQGNDLLSFGFVNGGEVLGHVWFGIGDDFYDGRNGVVGGTVFGFAGNDELLGGSATDSLDGGYGADQLLGARGDDTLLGGGGGDLLEGGAGRDALDGGAGNDRLVGGTNKDTLTGGDGADTFYFYAGEAGTGASSADVVVDFSHADGDKVHVRQMDADTGAGGDQNFSWIGTAAFTGVAGQLHYLHAGPNTFVEGDTDGDGTADFVIRLDGLHTLAAGDFVL